MTVVVQLQSSDKLYTGVSRTNHSLREGVTIHNYMEISKQVQKNLNSMFSVHSNPKCASVLALLTKPNSFNSCLEFASKTSENTSEVQGLYANTIFRYSPI